MLDTNIVSELAGKHEGRRRSAHRRGWKQYNPEQLVE